MVVVVETIIWSMEQMVGWLGEARADWLLNMNRLQKLKKEWTKFRTKALSEMFDNPDIYGIYPTTKFYEKIDKYFEQAILKEKREIEKLYEKRLRDIKDLNKEYDQKLREETIEEIKTIASLAFHRHTNLKEFYKSLDLFVLKQPKEKEWHSKN